VRHGSRVVPIATSSVILFAALLAVGAGVSARGVDRVARLGAPPDLVSIGLGSTTLAVQSMESAGTVTATVELYHLADGTRSLHHLGRILPLNSARLEIADLPAGAYAATVWSSGPVAVAARTEWTDTRGIASTVAAAPAADVIAPLVLKRYGAGSSTTLLGVQNSDRTRVTRVAVVLHAVGSDATAWQQDVDIPAGGGAVLDLGSALFDDVPAGFRGHARLRADVPIAVHAITTAFDGASVSAYEGIPADAAAARLVVPAITSRMPRSTPEIPGTAVTIVNPGLDPVTVRLRYRGVDATACAGEPFDGPPVVLAPGVSTTVSQDQDGGQGLPDGCHGTAVVTVTGGVVLGVNHSTDPATRSERTYEEDIDLVADADRGYRFAFPLVHRSRDQGDGFSLLSVINDGDSAATVRLCLRPLRSPDISCALAATATVLPAASTTFVVDRVLGYPLQDFDGAADITAHALAGGDEDVAIAAVAAEGRSARAGLYQGISASRAGTLHYVPFFVRPLPPPTATPLPTSTPSATPTCTPPPAPTPPLVPPIQARRAAYDFGDHAPLPAEVDPGLSEQYRGLGVDVDPTPGLTVVIETTSNRVQVFGPAGTVERVWGSTGRGPGQFRNPYDAAVAADGTTYVTDACNHRVQYFDRTGRFLGAWGRLGAGPGEFGDVAAAGVLSCGPRGIAVAPDRTVYVADTGNHRIQQFARDGRLIQVWGTRGPEAGHLERPYGLTVGVDGTVYVADTGNDRVQRFTAGGRWIEEWPSEPLDDPGWLSNPLAVAVDAGGAMYASSAEGEVVAYRRDGVTRWRPISTGSAVTGLAVAADGTVLAADAPGGFVSRLDAAGVVVGTLGTPRTDTEAHLVGPSAVEEMLDGSLLAVDACSDGSRGRLVRLGASGLFDRTVGSVTTSSARLAAAPDGSVYATGISDDSDRIAHLAADGSRLPDLALPSRRESAEDVAVAQDGAIYVLEGGVHQVVRLSPDGRVLTRWSVDRDTSDIVEVGSIDVALDGSVFVMVNHTLQVFDADGGLRAAWGGVGTELGRFRDPTDLVAGGDGTVYVLEDGDRRVQRFDARGALLEAWPVDEPGEAMQERTVGSAVIPAISGLEVMRDGRVLVTTVCPEGRVRVFGPPEDTDGWMKVYANRWLAGEPVAIVRSEGGIADWGDGSPAPAAPADGFSVRTDRWLSLPVGWHDLRLVADGGARAWFGDRLFVDAWDAPQVLGRARVRADGRPRRLRIEYNDPSGAANVACTTTGVRQEGTTYLPVIRR
jgi:tripartite motif-containing protein 71